MQGEKKVRAVVSKMGRILTFTLSLFLLPAKIVAAASTFLPIYSGPVYQSSEVWIQGGNSIEANTTGAYLKISFSGRSLALVVDTSNNASELPKLGIRIDSGSVRDVQITERGSFVTVPLVSPSDLDSQAWHEARISLEGLGRDNRWIPPSGSLKIDSLKVLGFALDDGAQMRGPLVKNKRMVVYGDSITEGARMFGGDDHVIDKEWWPTWESQIAEDIGAEIGTVGYQGEGLEVSGGGGVPGLLYSFDQIRSGVYRNFSRPDYVFLAHGANGSPSSDQVLQMVANLRRAYPVSKIFLCVPFGGYSRSAITQAYYSQQDPNVHLVDLGDAAAQAVLQNSVDQLHPNPGGNRIIANLMESQISSFL